MRSELPPLVSPKIGEHVLETEPDSEEIGICPGREGQGAGVLATSWRQCCFADRSQRTKNKNEKVAAVSSRADVQAIAHAKMGGSLWAHLRNLPWDAAKSTSQAPAFATPAAGSLPMKRPSGERRPWAVRQSGRHKRTGQPSSGRSGSQSSGAQRRFQALPLRR